MASGTGRRWRQTAVWLHVITSVGWMAQALALFTLLTVSFSSATAPVRVSATSMAHTLDTFLLAPLANASAFTGFMLAATTGWGFFRHWWILTKFVITLVQLYAGIFVLSDALTHSAALARAGQPSPGSPALLAGTALMATAIAFQAWLSVTKPWGRTPWTGKRARTPKLPTAPTWVFTATVAAPLADIAITLAVGFPFPGVELVVLLIGLVLRRRDIARLREAGPSSRTVPAR